MSKLLQSIVALLLATAREGRLFHEAIRGPKGPGTSCPARGAAGRKALMRAALKGFPIATIRKAHAGDDKARTLIAETIAQAGAIAIPQEAGAVCIGEALMIRIPEDAAAAWLKGWDKRAPAQSLPGLGAMVAKLADPGKAKGETDKAKGGAKAPSKAKGKVRQAKGKRQAKGNGNKAPAPEPVTADATTAPAQDAPETV